MKRLPFLRVGLFGAMLVLASAGCSTLPQALKPAAAKAVHVETIAVLQDPALEESSGVARHLRQDDLLWTHNDSGDAPRLFAIDTEGRTVGVFPVEGASAIDWEDMASAVVKDQPLLFLGDIGDNEAVRPMYMIYVVREPDMPAESQAAGRLLVDQELRFIYEDGSHNCEALAVDSATGMIYLITKEKSGVAGVYELSPAFKGPDPSVARRIAALDVPKVVAMDISSDGTKAVVLTYGDAYLYRRTSGEAWASVFSRSPERLRMPFRRQGESVCFDAAGQHLYLTSEQRPAPVWRVDLEP